MRIIGLHISSQTNKSHLRALTPRWYPFISSKAPKDFNPISGPLTDDKIPSSFFKIFSNLPDINISCVVGYNGAGKSSLIEIVLKIINNFSIAVFSGELDENLLHLNLVKGIFAELYFEIDGKLYCIRNWDYNIEYFRFDDDNTHWNIPIYNNDAKTSVSILSQFFYTICVNYGIHSFNSDSFRSLEQRLDNVHQDRWFDKFFHRVDGYQTPLTIVPSRNNGVIDINNENKLARQRLCTLSTLLFAKGKESLIPRYTPERIRYIFKQIKTDEALIRFIRFLGVEDNAKDEYRVFFESMKIAWMDELVGFKSISEELRDTAVNYLTLKSLKISFTYSPYREKCIYPFTESNLCPQLKDMILNDESYVTDKIHSVLNFLDSNVYEDKNKGYITIESLIEDKRLTSYTDVVKILPPSFFVYDIEYKHENISGLTLDMLSSGEKQLIFTISAVLYHLSNLSTIPTNDNNRIPYHNVNVIFDEAELYFHPEFQRTFLFELLRKINLLGIDRRKIRSLNFLLVTHSPFVLSDVPSSNVLYLENVQSTNKNTFGANLYDIMKDGFFMKSDNGELANHKIIQFFDVYYDKDAVKRETGFLKFHDEFKYLANEVGEEYIRKTIERMFSEMEAQYKPYNNTLDKKIESIEMYLEKLKRDRDEKG